MSYLAQIQSTLTSYTDLNPPNDTVFYQIEIVKLGGCYPDSIYAKANTNYNSSRSNVANTIAHIPPDTTSVFEITGNDIDFKIYPNPNKGNFIIDIKTFNDDKVDIKVMNILGSCVYEENNISLKNSYRTNVNLEGLNSGVYFVIVQNKESRIAKRVIIQK